MSTKTKDEIMALAHEVEAGQKAAETLTACVEFASTEIRETLQWEWARQMGRDPHPYERTGLPVFWDVEEVNVEGEMFEVVDYDRDSSGPIPLAFLHGDYSGLSALVSPIVEAIREKEREAAEAKKADIKRQAEALGLRVVEA